MDTKKNLLKLKKRKISKLNDIHRIYGGTDLDTNSIPNHSDQSRVLNTDTHTRPNQSGQSTRKCISKYTK